MQKSQAVESLGQRRLMLPAWVKAALSANDRLKVFLTVFQAAAWHAAHPNRDLPDLANEIAAAGLNAGWLNNAVATATRIESVTNSWKSSPVAIVTARTACICW